MIPACKILVVNPDIKKGKKKPTPRKPADRKSRISESIERDNPKEESSGNLKRGIESQVEDSADEETPKKRKVELDTEVTVYVLVEPPAVLIPTTQGSKNVAVPPLAPITRGPFFFSPDEDFSAFKAWLAKSLPCKEHLLPITKLQWRYEKPANDKKKPIADEAGYSAMKKSLGQRKKDFVINICMPPPKKDEIVGVSSLSF